MGPNPSLDVDFTEPGAPTSSTPQPASERTTPMDDTDSPAVTADDSSADELPEGSSRPRMRFPRPKPSTVIVVAVALAAFAFITRSTAMSTSAAPSAAAPAGAATVPDQVNAALSYREENATFVGFTPTPPLLAAVGPDTLVIADPSAPSCVYGGFADGNVVLSVSDPSGAACTAEAVSAAQAAIDGAADAPVAEQPVSAEAAATLDAAASSLAMYASMGMSAGAGPFAGAEQMPLFDASVVSVAPDGSSVTVQAPDGAACATASVYPDGTMSPPHSAACA